MNRGKRALILILLFCLVSIFACRKSTPTWDTQILAPLVKTSLSINNLVTNTSVKVNPADSFVTLVYSDSLYSLNMDSLLKIPDTTLVNQIPSAPTTVLPGGALPLPAPTGPTQYKTGSVELTNAIIKSGYVKVSVSSYLTQPTDYTYSVPSATLGGNPLNVVVKVPAGNATTPATKDTFYDLSGYTVDFTGPMHNGNNLITTSISGIVDPSGGTLVISAFNPNGVTITATFYNIIPYYGQGYFGQITKSIGPSQASFPLFKNISSGILDLNDVTVNFTLENGFGVDARAFISQLTSINSRPGGTNFPLTASIINNAININRATQTYNPLSPVTPSIKTFNLTPNNSDILKWVDNMPTSIGYGIQITTNPPPIGNEGFTDFAFYGQGIKAYFDISVPLNIAANNLTLQDTTPVSFANSSQAKQIKSGTFSIYATNMFPFSAGLQIYILDNNMHITDSLCASPQLIYAADTNYRGIVTIPKNSLIPITLNTNQANALFSAKNIIIKAVFNTGCTTCIGIKYSKIYSTYQLNIKLVGNFDYQVKG